MNYVHGSYFGYRILNWNKSAAVYPILGLCETMFSLAFSFVTAHAVKGSLRDR